MGEMVNRAPLLWKAEQIKDFSDFEFFRENTPF
jgi:hypothetical protein